MTPGGLGAAPIQRWGRERLDSILFALWQRREKIPAGCRFDVPDSDDELLDPWAFCSMPPIPRETLGDLAAHCYGLARTACDARRGGVGSARRRDRTER